MTNFQGYVPLHTVVGCSSTADSDTRLRELEEPVRDRSSVKLLCETFFKRKIDTAEKKLPRWGSNCGPLGRKITKLVFFHCTRRPQLGEYLFIYLFICRREK
jgi:hypothetical protein